MRQQPTQRSNWAEWWNNIAFSVVCKYVKVVGNERRRGGLAAWKCNCTTVAKRLLICWYYFFFIIMITISFHGFAWSCNDDKNLQIIALRLSATQKTNRLIHSISNITTLTGPSNISMYKKCSKQIHKRLFKWLLLFLLFQCVRCSTR